MSRDLIASPQTNPFNWPGNLRLVLTPHMTRAINFSGRSVQESGRTTLAKNDVIPHSGVWNQGDQSSASSYKCCTCVMISSRRDHHGGKWTNNASLSRQIVKSLASRSWCTERVALYGSTTVSETLTTSMSWKMNGTSHAYCWSWQNWERCHHPVRIFFSEFAHHQASKTSTSSAT